MERFSKRLERSRPSLYKKEWNMATPFIMWEGGGKPEYYGKEEGSKPTPLA